MQHRLVQKSLQSSTLVGGKTITTTGTAHRVGCVILKHSLAPGCNSYSPKTYAAQSRPQQTKPTGTCLQKHRIILSLLLSLCSRKHTSFSGVFFCRASQISSLPRTTSKQTDCFASQHANHPHLEQRQLHKGYTTLGTSTGSDPFIHAAATVAEVSGGSAAPNSPKEETHSSNSISQRGAANPTGQYDFFI